jgi:PAS domain S-box-containing protein
MKAEEIVGRSREEVLDFEGKNFGILSEFYRQKDFEMLTAGQTTQSYEAQVYNRTTKKVLDLVVYRSLLTSVGGRFDGILAVATDVSDIRAVQRFHQRIFDSSPLPVYYKDRNLNYVMCNDLYAEWYDLPKSMFIGRNRKDLVQHIKSSAAGSEDKLALIEKIEESMKVVIHDHETDDINLSACLTSSISVLEHKVWNFKLHEMRDVIFYKHALIGESGFEGIICSMIDVTELRKFEQTRSDLLEALPFAVCSCNEDGNIVECNKLYASMVGLERKDLLGRNIADESIKKFHRFTSKPVYVSDNGRETYVEALGTEVSHNTLVLRTVVEDPGVKISTVFIYFQKGDLYESLAV